jgi:hypothetical protein
MNITQPAVSPIPPPVPYNWPHIDSHSVCSVNIILRLPVCLSRAAVQELFIVHILKWFAFRLKHYFWDKYSPEFKYEHKPNYVVTTVSYDKVSVVTYKKIKETKRYLTRGFTIYNSYNIINVINFKHAGFFYNAQLKKETKIGSRKELTRIFSSYLPRHYYHSGCLPPLPPTVKRILLSFPPPPCLLGMLLLMMEGKCAGDWLEHFWLTLFLSH